MSEEIGDRAEWYRVSEHLKTQHQKQLIGEISDSHTILRSIFPVLSGSRGNCLSKHDQKNG